MSYVPQRFQGVVVNVVRLADQAVIGADPTNSDFQAFLRWNAAQPTPFNLDPEPWTPPDQVQARRDAAKQNIVSEETLATRCALRVVHAAMSETRAKLNELIAAVGNPSVRPLVNRSWAQLLEAVRDRIDNERDPHT